MIKVEDLRPHFRAVKDQRSFNRAPKLKPTEVQKELAEQAVIKTQDKLPPRVINKLKERHQHEGHYINTIRYYPFPILAYDGSADSIKELINWGHTYAAIMKKIASAYRSSRQNDLRRFLHVSLMKFFPPHLLGLIENYRTTDDLAGAHLGDDNLGGRSVEWNLGAVGGLDEGYLVAEEVAGTWEPEQVTENDIRPVESDPVEAVRDALRWAYESHCMENHIRPSPNPFIASVEHDDIYGSTVSICERLRETGEDVYLCFTGELSFQNGRLLTASGRPVDLVYMDCHLEDFPEGHPILEAADENAVALDCSPFAHLVLRSKVILALLCSPAFLKVLALNQHERGMLERHLMPSFLWRRKTFTEGRLRFSSAVNALLADRRLGNNPFPIKDPDPAGVKRDEIVVKVAIGSVYGGSAVSVVEQKGEGYKTRDAANLISDLVNTLASKYTPLEASRILESVKTPLKAKIKELILLSLSRRLSDAAGKNKGAKGAEDPFWNEVETLWEALLSASSEDSSGTISPDVFFETLRRPLRILFDIDLDSEKSANNSLWSKLEKETTKALSKAGNPHKRKHALAQLLLSLGHILATIQFQRQGGGKIFGALMDRIKSVAKSKEKMSYSKLAQRVMDVIEKFFEKDLGTPMPEGERRQILSILLEPFIIKQRRSVNPIILQRYVIPPSLHGESALHIMNRVHILFTKTGTRAFISGAQAFFLKDSMPDNRYKMTGSLWVRR